MIRVYGYVRVSSRTQNEERQIKAMLEAGVEENFIFIDKQSGKDFNREQYQILKHALREDDLLVIQSIDRLGRNYEMIAREWQEITKDIKANIYVIDMPLLDTRKNKDLLGTFINDLILSLLSYVAQTEREKIKIRQREGLNVMPIKNGKRVSIKTGRAIGRPCAEKPYNWDDVITRWTNNEITAVKAMKELDLKETTFYKLVKKYKVRRKNNEKNKALD